MKTISIRFSYVLAALVVGMVLSFIHTPAGVVSAEQTIVNQSWKDDFTSPSLDDRWFWVREDIEHWNLITEQPGFLRITTQQGSIYHNSNNDGRNILLTSVNQPIFQISTKVSFSPSEDFHTAGILVYQDDDNYVFLSRVVVNDDQRIRFYVKEDGVIDIPKDIEAFSESATTFYCRITKRGNLYIGQYSLDGINWTEVDRLHASLDNPSVGLMANNGASTMELPADFDYFELSGVPFR